MGYTFFVIFPSKKNVVMNVFYMWFAVAKTCKNKLFFQ